ncbi:ABC transporter substrate-binding protein [Siccirubricoccus sp. KC 17139]|uniref:ABC transporter substrate-binding protein n=1 Tax=Siccirubricoccus soli TaxID=2899147 RepID=A0ABT1D0E0_9PROT|nr:ABC transporter substrate-binding protein [Siccirubricoccus soli]MCO6415391.1 ABC transporter substrate-binding protein [Siccirubricoccus soli]MCP2681523.1 ABC transporter substrate-binding protein [Siccirubricoccus soli]
MLRRSLVAGATALPLAAPTLLRAQGLPKITIGMSGWTGFAPLTLAEQAGLFKANGVEVETRFVPQRERNLALASGALNCVVTTVDTMILWASTIPLVQVLVLDRSHGGDGVGVRPSIRSFADLKGKTVAVDGPGTSPYFMLAYMLRENGLSVKEVQTATLAPQPAAQAFVAGQFDACATYEPYLSQVRAMGEDKGKILATTLDHPCIVDTLAFQPAFLQANPDAVKRVTKSWFDAVEMIKREPDRSHEIMGARTRQSAEEFKKSASFIEWLDLATNREYAAAGLPEFMRKAHAVQRETGVVRQDVDLSKLYDGRFLG